MMEYNENLASDLSRLCKRFLESEKMTGDKISKSEKMILMKLETNANNLTSLSLETKNINQKTDTAFLEINKRLDQSAETVQNLEKTLNGYI